MSDKTSETTETFEVPDDLSELDSTQEPKPYRTLLEIWRAVLEPAREVSNDPISPQWATKMVSTYPEVRYADVERIHHGVFSVAAELAALLDEVIASDDESLKKLDEKEDAEQNAALYRRILIDWQVFFVEREARWTPSHPDAAVELAILSEVQQMFLGQTGLVAHLDSIGFQYTEADQQELTEALVAAKAAVRSEEVEGE